MTYRDRERKFFKVTYKLRTVVYDPFLKFLANLGVTANHITYLRGVILVWMLYEMFVKGDLLSGSIIYFAFLFIDTIDGSLARYRKEDNDKGKFNDVIIDQLGYALFVLGLAFIGVANTFILFYHVIIAGFGYLVAVAYKNQNEKSDWVVRPEGNLSYFKLIALLALLILLIFKVNLIDFTAIVLNIWMTITAIYHLIKLQKEEYKG